MYECRVTKKTISGLLNNFWKIWSLVAGGIRTHDLWSANKTVAWQCTYFIFYQMIKKISTFYQRDKKIGLKNRCFLRPLSLELKFSKICTDVYLEYSTPEMEPGHFRLTRWPGRGPDPVTRSNNCQEFGLGHRTKSVIFAGVLLKLPLC